MTTVVLVRHGRTSANAAGVLAGDLPVGLDELGREQAVAVGVRLAGLHLAAVVSSPLPRCRETLRLAVPDTDVTVDDRLTECGYGEWSGRKLSELAEEPLWRTVQQQPAAVRFPGGESLAELSARSVAAMRDWDRCLQEAHGPDAVWLACSHGDVIKSIVADALGLHLDLFQRIAVAPGSLTVVQYGSHRPTLLRLSDSGAALPSGGPPPDGDAAVGGGK